MYLALIILSIIAWMLSIVILFRDRMVASAVSYIALLILSLAQKNGYPIVPLNATILICWLCMTLIITTATWLQPPSIRHSPIGIGYITGGALTGMVIGLLGNSFTYDITILYGIMIIATAIGTFFGYLLFVNTPKGRNYSFSSGIFFRYLLAQGFPVAITIMMIGTALVLFMAVNNNYA